jgi:MerR family transcriptional regulator, thiopeptide resistance regulator
MEVGVEELAKLSGVSVRTLHYYDEIGLLKPAIRLSNGRRTYTTEECLRLMEILFFKKSKFSLKKIQTILDLRDVNKIAVLAKQKEALLKEIKNLENVIESINRTILHYKGNKMTKEEVVNEFKNLENKMKAFEKESEKVLGKEKMDEVREKCKELSKEEIEQSCKWTIQFFEKLVEAIKSNISAGSSEIQSLMREYFDKSRKFNLPVSKEHCLRVRDVLCKDLFDTYERFHKGLPKFLSEAIEIYANSLVE